MLTSYAHKSSCSYTTGFINTETEKLILVPYCDIDNWPDAYCNVDEPPSGYTQHTAIDSWKFIYISTVSNGINTAASVIAVTYESIDWDGGSVDGLKVLNVYPYADITTPSEFEGIFETDSKQPIVPWLSPSFAAVHGPTFRPGDNKSVFWGTWTYVFSCYCILIHIYIGTYSILHLHFSLLFCLEIMI